MRKVMVLEDESSIRSFIVINLRRAGYEVVEAETGEEALDKLHENPDTLVALLDVMLPGIDGFEVCRRIRATNPRIGIIMLTARSQEMDKVTGLMNGADDYVTKPFSPVELTARVDALIRRSSGGTPGLVTMREHFSPLHPEGRERDQRDFRFHSKEFRQTPGGTAGDTVSEDQTLFHHGLSGRFHPVDFRGGKIPRFSL